MAVKSMRSKKRIHKKSKKGGFLFTKKVVPEICSTINIDELNTSSDLHAKYQSCCPKNFLGFKNRSPLCKNLDNKFQQVIKEENESVGRVSMMEDEGPLPQPILPSYVTPPSKKWYEFWKGGKKTKHRNSKGKKSKKTRKHRGIKK